MCTPIKEYLTVNNKPVEFSSDALAHNKERLQGGKGNLIILRLDGIYFLVEEGIKRENI